MLQLSPLAPVASAPLREFFPPAGGARGAGGHFGAYLDRHGEGELWPVVGGVARPR